MKVRRFLRMGADIFEVMADGIRANRTRVIQQDIVRAERELVFLRGLLTTLEHAADDDGKGSN